MLGRLIQGYARGSQLESATDETHTRTLLWPELAPDARLGHGSLSPPTTPLGSPGLRVSPYDDRVGLDLHDTKDLRLVIAQDAFGTNDRPLVLFDTHTVDAAAAAHRAADAQSPLHSQGSSQPAAPPTPGQGPGAAKRTPSGIPVTGHARHRSSTISGASTSASWMRQTKDPESADQLSTILDCMFGVSSATKSGSSTKMHLLPGDRGSPSDLGLRTTSATTMATGTHPHVPLSRVPLLRAKTSTNAVHTQRQHLLSKDPDAEARDAVLITRMFSVTIPDGPSGGRQDRSYSAGQSEVVSPLSPPDEGRELLGKKPKLVEKKTPAYAIGLLCYLPRSTDGRPHPAAATATARPPSRTAFSPSSAPHSYGSDSPSSWVFLNAIPEHLWAPHPSGRLSDKSIELIVRNWDVVVRSLTAIEATAAAEIGLFLQEMNYYMASSAAKAPKGPSEQRTNQRNVYLRAANILAPVDPLHRLAKHTLWRVAYALRVPRVLTGFGLENDGHWLDEARYLVRFCGTKQQSFFLFNLLTAFLGNHPEWLEALGPDWYRKQARALRRNRALPVNINARTVIVGDNRSMVRRIIFLLSSFLPRSSGLGPSALVQVGNGAMSPLLTPDVSSSSPVGRLLHEDHVRRHSHSHHHARSRDGPMTFPRREVTGLSSSVSSSDSVGALGMAIRGGSRSLLSRPDLDADGHAPPVAATPADGSHPVRLLSAHARSSTNTSGTGTPVPHFATQADGHFSDALTTHAEESSASADLARILRQDSVGPPVAGSSSTKWGTLISNVSGLWTKKPESTSPASTSLTSSTGGTAAGTGTLAERRQHAPRSVPIQRHGSNHLENMVHEAAHVDARTPDGRTRDSPVPAAGMQSIVVGRSQPPHLRVDAHDGVVDVDINLPGFLGWNEGKGSSPASSFRFASPPLASSDEAASSYSSKSHPGYGGGSKIMNVAGYLQRYHEDFILQGVRPYGELDEDVKQSMAREMCAADDMHASLWEEQANGEVWVDVATTLVADMRSFTIQRVTLKRRVEQHADDELLAATGPTGARKEGDSWPEPSPKPVTKLANDHDRFVSEPVMDFDATLADAIERVLNDAEQVRQKGTGPRGAHARAISTGTASSVRSEMLDGAGLGRSRDTTRYWTQSQSECRQAVVGALEEVVKSVHDSLDRPQGARGCEGGARVPSKMLQQEFKQDNVLREGVKKWLLTVESRSAW